MPVSLIAPSRRRFLQTSALTSLGIVTDSFAADSQPWVALMADTHIDADPATIGRGANMADNLTKVVAEILAEPSQPEFAVINGDCAYLKGLKSDYQTLRPLVQPLLDAGISVHLTMGNHDDRAPFYGLFPEAKEALAEQEKHLTIIETEAANWFLLDTLQIVNNVTGEIGADQLDWLSSELDRLAEASPGKPAMLIGHHYPQDPPEDSTARISGLADTLAFMELMRSRPQVKAYIYGHSHSYGFKKDSGGAHLINQPPVAYVFNKTRPNGWIRASVGKGQMQTELRALNREHPLHGDKRKLEW